jgi:hypothetical protein
MRIFWREPECGEDLIATDRRGRVLPVANGKCLNNMYDVYCSMNGSSRGS